jgi:hypothetical protein
MSSIEPESTPQDPSSGGLTSPAGEPAVAASVRPASGIEVTRRVWLLALAAGIAAGSLGWLSVEGALRAYRSSLMPAMKPFPTPEDTMKTLRAQVDSGTVAFGAMGALFGLAFGLAGGAARGSARAALDSALPGLVLGGLAVAGTAWLILPVVIVRMDPQSSDLTIPLLCHVAVWSVAGAAGGFAFGLGVGGRALGLRTALGGFLGAALASAVYELVGALGFPAHRTHLPVSSSPETRALAQILVGLGTAIGVVLATREPNPKRRPVAEGSRSREA